MGLNWIESFFDDFASVKKKVLEVLKGLPSMKYDDHSRILHENMKKFQNTLNETFEILTANISLELAIIKINLVTILDELKDPSSNSS